MITDAQHAMLKERGIMLADDASIICAAAVLSQALQANEIVDVDVLNDAYDEAFWWDGDLTDSSMMKDYLKTLANRPIPEEPAT